MEIKDLPPVPDLSTLSIHVDEKECVHMGNISAVVGEFGKNILLFDIVFSINFAVFKSVIKGDSISGLGF